MRKMLALILGVMMLSACCCMTNGMDPVQPHQFEKVTPPDANQQ